MRAAAAVLASILCAGPALAASARPPPVGCASFVKDLPDHAPALRLSFDRPLTISRGFGESQSGVDVYVLRGDADVDGTLRCRGDSFLRFEARVALPAQDKAVADFATIARAALVAAFRWDHNKAETVERALSQDAGEYLRASIQRGDLYNAGKVEYHQGQTLDLGLIWTESDRSFILSNQNQDE